MPVLLISLTIALLDQLTKHWVLTVLVDQPRTVVPGLFDLRYVLNTGAAFGMLAGQNGWLVLLSFVMIVVIVVFRRHFITDTWTHKAAMGLILGGIVGNLIDRVRLEYVVDFLDFYWGQAHFPAFNIADAAICTGVGLYMLSQFVTKKAPAPSES